MTNKEIVTRYKMKQKELTQIEWIMGIECILLLVIGYTYIILSLKYLTLEKFTFGLVCIVLANNYLLHFKEV